MFKSTTEPTPRAIVIRYIQLFSLVLAAYLLIFAAITAAANSHLALLLVSGGAIPALVGIPFGYQRRLNSLAPRGATRVPSTLRWAQLACVLCAVLVLALLIRAFPEGGAATFAAAVWGVGAPLSVGLGLRQIELWVQRRAA